MSQNLHEEQLIRRYFLNDLPDQEQEQVEERLFTDQEFFEASLVIEGELVDDYALGLLPEGERRKLERRFLTTPQQYRGVRLARDLEQYISSGQHGAGRGVDLKAKAITGEEAASPLAGLFSRVVGRKRFKVKRGLGSATKRRSGDWERLLGEAQANRSLAYSLIADDWLGLQLLARLKATSPATLVTLAALVEGGDADLTAALTRLVQCGLVEEHQGAFSCSRLGSEVVEKLEEVSGLRLSTDSI